MKFSGYVSNRYSFKKIPGHKLYLYRNPRWRPKLKMAVGNVWNCLYFFISALQNLYSCGNVTDIEYKYINLKLNEHQDGRQNPRCLSKIERCNLSKIFVWTTILNFRIPACNFHDMLAIYTALPRDTRSTFIGIQDGGQNTKWLSGII